MKTPIISVIIPAFNEENTIRFVLHGVHKVLQKIGVAYEVIVVNDGSTDKTAVAAKEHNVVLIDNPENSGKGSALRAGFSRAKGRFLVTMDADGSHQPSDIPYLVSPIMNGDDADAVTGSRFVDNLGRNSTTKLHLIGNRIINLVILLLTGRRISDSQCGFRAFRREVLKNIALTSTGYDVESEMTIKMLRSGLRIRETPIRCRERKSGSTRINSFSDGFGILKAILKSTFCA